MVKNGTPLADGKNTSKGWMKKNIGKKGPSYVCAEAEGKNLKHMESEDIEKKHILAS